MIAWRLILGGWLLAAASGALAQGQARIPGDAERGTLSPGSGMSVVLDGSAARLAAGAVIRDQSNLVIVPGAVPPNSDVRYSRDPQGNISRVWIMTNAERQTAPRGPGIMRFLFGR